MQRVSNKGKETEKPLCVVGYKHNKGGVDLKDQLLHMYKVERKKNDQMVPQTFRKVTKLYSSQFVCCLLISDGKKYTAALAYNSATGRSVYEICACCGNAECTGATGIRQNSSTDD